MDTNRSMAGLTAHAFFARGLAGCSMSDAHLATGLAYSTVNDVAKQHHESAPRIDTLKRLERWSRDAGAQHGVYISAALTLGLVDHTASDFAKAAGE